jgi:hypothetical protein
VELDQIAHESRVRGDILAVPTGGFPRRKQPGATTVLAPFLSGEFGRRTSQPPSTPPRDAYVLLSDNAPDFFRKDPPFLPPGGGRSHEGAYGSCSTSGAFASISPLLRAGGIGESASGWVR